jgi:hypothetical protein
MSECLNPEDDEVRQEEVFSEENEPGDEDARRDQGILRNIPAILKDREARRKATQTRLLANALKIERAVEIGQLSLQYEQVSNKTCGKAYVACPKKTQES